MNDLAARLAVLSFYVAALASFFVDFPPLFESVLRYGTVALLVAHALEVVFCFRWVRLYPGPLLLSICLTLLFGFVHWMPFKKRAEAGAAG